MPSALGAGAAHGAAGGAQHQGAAHLAARPPDGVVRGEPAPFAADQSRREQIVGGQVAEDPQQDVFTEVGERKVWNRPRPWPRPCGPPRLRLSQQGQCVAGEGHFGE